MATKAGAKLGLEQDIDLLKAVIKDLLNNIEGKKPISWDKVASYMGTDVKPDTLRKRFDKFKPEKTGGGASGSDGGNGEAVATVNKKKATAKPKTEKAKAKGKAKKAEVDEEVEEKEPVGETDVKGEDEPSSGKEASTATSTSGEKKVRKATKPRKRKATKDSDIIEPDEEVAKKRVRASATPEENYTDAEGQDGEDELADSGLPTPPKRGRPTKEENAAKKARLEGVAADGDEESEGLQI